MGIWDDVGKGLIGAGTGYLTGGGLGGLAGGLTGGLLTKGKPLTLGTGLASGLLGGVAGGVTGALGKGIGSAWERAKTRADLANEARIGQESGVSPTPGLWDTTKAFGQELWSGAKGLGGVLAPGKLGGLGGLSGGLGSLGGLGGGSGAGGGVGGVPGAVGGSGGVAQGQGYGGRSGMQNLALLGGMGALGAGLMQDVETPDLEALLSGGQAQTRGMIEAQVAAEQARRQAAEEQYLQSRETARKQLEDVIGAQSDFAMQQAIQARQEQLNRQGLLGGPSGAMDFALAQEAARLRQSQLPQLLAFNTGTQTGLEGMRGAGLEGSLGLERAGVERQFGQTDQQTQARLLTQLLDAERKNRQRQALIETGGAGIGYGLGGGMEGLQGVGGALGRLFSS